MTAPERVLSHPSGATYVVGSSAPDDEERMTCERAGEVGHAMCGVHPCCGWPRFLVCPDDERIAGRGR